MPKVWFSWSHGVLFQNKLSILFFLILVKLSWIIFGNCSVHCTIIGSLNEDVWPSLPTFCIFFSLILFLSLFISPWFWSFLSFPSSISPKSSFVACFHFYFPSSLVLTSEMVFYFISNSFLSYVTIFSIFFSNHLISEFF